MTFKSLPCGQYYYSKHNQKQAAGKVILKCKAVKVFGEITCDFNDSVNAQDNAAPDRCCFRVSSLKFIFLPDPAHRPRIVFSMPFPQNHVLLCQRKWQMPFSTMFPANRATIPPMTMITKEANILGINSKIVSSIRIAGAETA